MLTQFAEWIETRFRIPAETVQRSANRLSVTLLVAVFVLLATFIMAFDDIFTGFDPVTTLSVGDLAPFDIAAPSNQPFVSQVLTQQERQAARDAVQPLFDPPDPNVARQQNLLAQQILDYIEDVRRDPYGELALKIQDLDAITALTLDDRVAESIIRLDDEIWALIESEILNVLPRVMRESIRQSQLQTVRDQLRNQVSIRFNTRERDVIVAIVEDLIRPNTFENVEATEAARDTAETAVTEVRRSFVRGESIISEDQRITETDYEALRELGLLGVDDTRRPQEIGRIVLANIVAVVLIGLYIANFQPRLLYQEPQLMMMVGAIFLLMLAAARFIGLNNMYLFPSAALALIYVATTGVHVAVICSVVFGILVGLMSNNSLEIVSLIIAGGIIGTLALRRAERLNTFFVAGGLVGIINGAVVAIFNLATPVVANGDVGILTNIAEAFISGALLVPAAAITVMYVLTVAFNLPTMVKLADLNQPSKPLLQRLLREAPGTYQHSLMVGNLASQAANAIGADSQLTQVAALYHDIGKMTNPVFFVENQQGINNPHDTLNDPYRSADIIIGHVTEGDELARQYKLPGRIRDFIREHHGTTQVYVFYQRALAAAGDDPSSVDIEDFTYVGPKPQSRETAIMMMADSCESAVRAANPKTKQEISEIVNKIVEGKRSQGQLDECGLTLNDLNIIQRTFVDMLQGVYHARVNYQDAVRQQSRTTSETVRKPDAVPVVSPATAPKVPVNTPKTTPAVPKTDSTAAAVAKSVSKTPAKPTAPTPKPATTNTTPSTNNKPAPSRPDDDDARSVAVPQPDAEDIEEPLTEVPRLPSADERRSTGSFNHVRISNGKSDATSASDTTDAKGDTSDANHAEADETDEQAQPQKND